MTILINLVYYYLMNRHTYSHLPNMCQSWDIGLDSLYCGKWRKNSKSGRDLDLDQAMPNVELVRAIFIHYSMFNFQVDWTIIFWVIVYTDRHTHTDPTHRQTDRHECSIVFNRNYNKAYTCLCLSKSDAIERIKNAKFESSLRCLTWRKPTQEIFGKERHKPDAGKKRLVGARL